MKKFQKYLLILFVANIVSCAAENAKIDESTRANLRNQRQETFKTNLKTPFIVKAEYMKGRVPGINGHPIIRGEFNVMSVIKGDFPITTIQLRNPPVAEDDPKLMTDEIEATPLGGLKFGKIYIVGLEPTLSIKEQIRKNSEKGYTWLWVNEEDLTIEK